MSAGELWAVHIQGPDDVIACVDRESADSLALELNKIIEQVSSPMSPNCAATVIEWPYGLNEWVADLEKEQR